MVVPTKTEDVANKLRCVRARSHATRSPPWRGALLRLLLVWFPDTRRGRHVHMCTCPGEGGGGGTGRNLRQHRRAPTASCAVRSLGASTPGCYISFVNLAPRVRPSCSTHIRAYVPRNPTCARESDRFIFILAIHTYLALPLSLSSRSRLSCCSGFPSPINVDIINTQRTGSTCSALLGERRRHPGAASEIHRRGEWEQDVK